MTATDWVGLIVTVITFFLMLGLYLYVLAPKNKERIESYRNIPLDDEVEIRNEKR